LEALVSLTLVGQLLFQFGFIFLMSYFVILLSSKIKHRHFQSLICGSLLAFVLIAVVLIQRSLGWQSLPNGRNFFVIFSILFWGPLASLPVAFGVVVAALFYPTFYIIQDLVVFCFLALISLGYRWGIKKYAITIKWPHILLIAITPVIIALPLANILYPNETAVSQATGSILLILITYTVLNSAIFYAFFREREREINLRHIQKANEELASQNEEIRTLYEEIAASEEALQESFIELDNYKNRLEYNVYHDAKTNLFNHDYLNKELVELDLAKQHTTVLLYLRAHDIERLVDTLGQTLAEILHTIMAKILYECLHKYENYRLYHIAQGRFALLIESYTEEVLQKSILEITDRLKNTQLVENMLLPVDLDIGGLHLDTAQDESSLWLESAEIAMIESSKDTIRNHVIWFSQTMYDKKQYQTRLEFDLQRAIERNEMFLVIQPQYTKNKEMIGAEVLLRWSHKEFGLISPKIFIPLAERLGLIGSIGKYVLSETIGIIENLMRQSAMHVPISINTSMIELIDSNFSQNLTQSLKRHHIMSSLLNIEITESSLIEDMNHIKNNIDKMLEAGLNLHLDDFGTGYSSLSQLSSLPISYIKIDKAFIDEVLISDRSMQVVKTIIELAHRLDMSVIAEGVEHYEQLVSLDAIKCDFYQGYYFSKPIPIDDFFNILTLKNDKF
jgi:EAL domain-containing protein (putative c-di-GMP-specific phosphodiesterase class I)/GGDEF domain-containing protein